MSRWRSASRCSNITCKACGTMKARKHEIRMPGPAPAPVSKAAALVESPVRWQPYALAGIVLLAVVWAYAPAAHGPFLFDDNTLPFALPSFNAPFSVWVDALRPLLMLS